jgi:putative addiction module component (TIGR02574 family)
MSKTNDILKEAITLPPSDRAILIDKLLNSLDEQDNAIDTLWAKEAESRIDAYDKGRLKSISIDKIIEKYR